jgi:hypothetical protein
MVTSNWRNFHLVLVDGSERNVRAREVSVDDTGALHLSNEKETQVIYAPGQWKMVEVEQKDDKG